MIEELVARASKVISEAPGLRPVGRVTSVSGTCIEVSGLSGRIGIGDRAFVLSPAPVKGEIVRLSAETALVLTESPTDGVRIGDRVRIDPPISLSPDPSWKGRVINPDGEPLDGRALLPGLEERPLMANPPPPQQRDGFGERFGTGLAVFDTLLPIVRGQRIGLFAGSGVGKSTLLADLARGLTADVIVLALVGERGREVRHFIESVLGPEGLKRSIVVVATSDEAPQLRRRCAWSAMAIAEYFRDRGEDVVLLMDSVTRFAEAHREIAVAAGDPVVQRGFPSTTVPTIAALSERAGPGSRGVGSITAIFSVLVAGSDMEEPIADTIRGLLDGHVVLDREIAERGRFPAVNLLRSVSRSLPAAATDAENRLLSKARSILGAYERSAMMIQAGLYSAGADERIDQAIEFEPKLEAFLATSGVESPAVSFSLLRQALPRPSAHAL